ncbi:uncharacterized protein LOC144579341 [Callithrix jacchus]
MAPPCGRWGRAGPAARPGAAAPRPGSSSALAAAAARAPSLPPGPPACLARSLPPSARCRAPSLRLLRRVPPSHPFSPPSSFPPSGRPPAQASARRSPPAAALARAPALRSRPGRQRRLGGPGAPRRERPGRAAGPSALGATSRPLRPRRGPRTPGGGGPDPAPPRPGARPERPASATLSATPSPSCRASPQPSPRGAPCYLALPLRWVPASSTGRRDSGPSSPPAGVKCLPLQPAEPPAAFALQFFRPPPEPTALCLPQHWGWGQQRRPNRAATPSQVPPRSGGHSALQGQGRSATALLAVPQAPEPL